MRKFFIPVIAILLIIFFLGFAINIRSSPKEVMATIEEIEEHYGKQKIMKLDGTDFFEIYGSKLVKELSTFIDEEKVFLKILTIRGEGEVEVGIKLSKEFFVKDGKHYIYGLLIVDNAVFFVNYQKGYELVTNHRFVAKDY